MRDIFWVKEEIIHSHNIRDSRDEELIGFLIADMILEKKQNLTAKALNAFYGFSANPLSREPIEKTSIEAAIDRISIDVIKKQFGAVFSIIQELLVASKTNFRKLIYKKSDGSRISNVFHVIYMAIFNIIVKQNKKVADYKILINQLSGIGDDLFTGQNVENIFHFDYRDKAIKSVIGRIECAFTTRENTDPIYDDWTMEFDKILMKSITEQNMYDFKIGLADLVNGKFNKDLILKIAKTLTAISNLGPNLSGYVIMGVADREEHAKQFEKFYNDKPVNMHRFHITGIEAEANMFSNGIDKYLHTIKETIKQAPITPENFKNDILINMFSRQYYGKEILVFKIGNAKQPAWFEGKLFERHMSHNQEVPISLHQNVYERFYNK